MCIRMRIPHKRYSRCTATTRRRFSYGSFFPRAIGSQTTERPESVYTATSHAILVERAYVLGMSLDEAGRINRAARESYRLRDKQNIFGDALLINGEDGVHSRVNDTNHAPFARTERQTALEGLVVALADAIFKSVWR